MKLQIISRLTKQPTRVDNLKETQLSAYSSIETTQRKFASQYCSVNNDGKEGERSNVRDFFAQFNSKCEVKYKPVQPVFREVKRKLEPVLQTIKDKQQKNTPNVIDILPLKSEPIMCKELKSGDDPIFLHLQADPKQTFYFQRAHQKIRKVNSLISLDNQRSSNSIESTRKPGFIRMNKSLAKKESSLTLHLSKETKQQSTEQSERQAKLQLKSGRSGVKMQQQISDSRERIARIRRELNQIYQMRSKPAQARLRLC